MIDIKIVQFIENAKRLVRLKDNPDFQLYIDIIKSKKKDYDNVFKHPRPVGTIDKRDLGGGRYEYFKYSKEDDTERLKEAQIRSNTFDRCITMIDDWESRAMIYEKQEKDKIDQVKSKKSVVK